MRTKKFVFIAPILISVGCAVFFSLAAFISTRGFTQIWRGYYTLLVSDGRPVSEVQERLARSRLSAVASDNTYVEFNDFAADARVSVSRLPSRLDAMDPRYDPYMKELGGYYHQGRWNIFYVPSSLPPPFAYAKIARSLRGLDWRLADFSPRTVLLCVGVWALATLFIYLRARRARIGGYVALAGSIPWLAGAMSGSYLATLAGTLVYLGWSTELKLGLPMLRYYLDYHVVDRERLAPMGAAAAAALFAGSVLASIDARITGFLLRGTAVLVLLAVALGGYELCRHRYRTHPLFFPVRIAEGGRAASFVVPRILETFWIALALLISPGIVLLSQHADVEIPTPVVYPGVAHNSWAGLHRMWENGAEPGLPDLSDYVAHRAYQAGLPYGRQYTFPIPNERVYETRYTRDGTRIVGRMVAVRVYTEKWFREILADAGGVVRIIEEQRHAVLPVRRRLYDFGYPSAISALFWVVVLGLLPPVLFVRRGRSFDTVGRASDEVSVVPAVLRPHYHRLPEKPWHARARAYAAETGRQLVSERER